MKYRVIGERREYYGGELKRVTGAEHTIYAPNEAQAKHDFKKLYPAYEITKVEKRAEA